MANEVQHQQNVDSEAINTSEFITNISNERIAWADEFAQGVEGAAASSTSQATQEADWVKDFANQQAKQG